MGAWLCVGWWVLVGWSRLVVVDIGFGEGGMVGSGFSDWCVVEAFYSWGWSWSMVH